MTMMKKIDEDYCFAGIMNFDIHQRSRRSQDHTDLHSKYIVNECPRQIIIRRNHT